MKRAQSERARQIVDESLGNCRNDDEGWLSCVALKTMSQ